MLKNYLKTAFRSLLKNKSFSFINIFGLSVGLACCMLIGAYLYQELSYDTYSEKTNQLYRVGLHLTENGKITDFPMVDYAVGPGIKNTYPGVIAFTRLTGRGQVFIKYNDKQFKEQKVAIVDSNFLQLFSIPFIEGDRRTALTSPNGIVITKDFSKKYFGDQPALGKTLEIKGEGPVKVTGVIDKVPDNSHFHFDAFRSMLAFKPRFESWSNVGDFTYLLLDKNADPKVLEAQFPQLVSKYVVPEIQHDMGVSLAEAQKSVNTFRFFLQPIKDIHLKSSTKFELEPAGDIHYIYIFGALALFILTLACINFTNLSIASSVKRSKEVGIRKVLGSIKSWLVSQFLVESIMLTAAAMILAIAMIYLLLPYFNNISGKQITIQYFVGIKMLLLEAAVVLVVGFMAGVYPAFFISSFKILNVLKGNSTSNADNRNLLRSSLIVFQFAVSTALIISTIIVYQQLHYMQNKKLGYDKEQVLVINDAYMLGTNLNVFRNDLAGNSNVVNATICSSVPGNNNMDGTQIYGKESDDTGNRNEIHTNIYHIDENYLPTLNIEMAKGRNFSQSFPGDSASVIINEATVRDLGWGKSDPLGKTIVRSGNKHFTVIGVVKDFNYSSAKQKVAPLMMLWGHSTGSLIVKIKAKDVQSLVSNIKDKWESYNPGAPFTFSFLDEQYAALYASENRTGQIFTSFAVVALIIASLGLFGLAAFMIRQRVKEIGIRKVLGASSVSISHMLSAEFLKLVGIAIIISFPVTWFAMNKWLEDFAYRIDIQWWVFIVAGCLAIAIAYLTVSFQSIKAAVANPVKSLRSE